MLHRRTSDGDAVAAAQRRLDAISAQFAPAVEHRRGNTPLGVDSDDSTGESAADGTASEADPQAVEPARDTARLDAGRQPDTARLDPGRHADTAQLGRGRHADAARLDPGRHAGSPPAGRYGRWGLSPYHVVILAVVAFALVTVAAWWVMQSIPRAPVQLASERSVPEATASAAATAPATSVASGAEASAAAPAATLTSPAAEPVVVDVAGKVRRPGIVELPAGARVVDALDAAGGARIGVDTRSLNLARLLVDGEQIVVGYDVPTMPGGQVPEAGAGLSGSPPTSTGPAITPVDLNTATAEQLDTIPGIGPVTAQAILAWRTEHGASRRCSSCSTCPVLVTRRSPR